MEGALGIIEIRGLATAVVVADIMVKTAAIEIIDVEQTQGGEWTTVKVSGNVAAVSASISAGRQIGEKYKNYISSKIISRPTTEVAKMFCKINVMDNNGLNSLPLAAINDETADDSAAVSVREKEPEGTPIPVIMLEPKPVVEHVSEPIQALELTVKSAVEPEAEMEFTEKSELPPKKTVRKTPAMPHVKKTAKEKEKEQKCSAVTKQNVEKSRR